MSIKIGNTIKSIPKHTVDKVNDLGGHALNFAKETVDKFCKSKPNNPNKIELKKETLVGAVLVYAALKAGIGLFKAVKNKISESKKNIDRN